MTGKCQVSPSVLEDIMWRRMYSIEMNGLKYRFGCQKEIFVAVVCKDSLYLCDGRHVVCCTVVYVTDSFLIFVKLSEFLSLKCYYIPPGVLEVILGMAPIKNFLYFYGGNILVCCTSQESHNVCVIGHCSVSWVLQLLHHIF